MLEVGIGRAHLLGLELHRLRQQRTLHHVELVFPWGPSHGWGVLSWKLARDVPEISLLAWNNTRGRPEPWRLPARNARRMVPSGMPVASS